MFRNYTTLHAFFLPGNKVAQNEAGQRRRWKMPLGIALKFI